MHLTHCGAVKNNTREKMIEKLKFDLLCINKKEKTCYREYHGCKSVIDLAYQWIQSIDGSKNLTLEDEYKSFSY